jgi:deoxyribodipyrimidine photo-lyase
VLPIFVFPAQQVEVSGFLASEHDVSPYPEARSEVAGFWRCGKHRTKFMAETVFDLQRTFRDAKSDLILRVGMIGDVLRETLATFKDLGNGKVVKVVGFRDLIIAMVQLHTLHLYSVSSCRVSLI